MIALRKKAVVWCAAGILLLMASNMIVATRYVGTRAGQTYRWACPESGAELSYNPSVFGSARLSPSRVARGRTHRWELVEPRRPSPWLPWNWLALVVDQPDPDPEAVIAQWRLEPG